MGYARQNFIRLIHRICQLFLKILLTISQKKENTLKNLLLYDRIMKGHLGLIKCQQASQFSMLSN